MTRKAFTLIELMVTISIIAILATIAVPIYDRMILKARSDEAKAIIQSIVFAQDRFRQERGKFYIDGTNEITNEQAISGNLRIGLAESNNFNYSIEGLGDGNFTIKAVLRVDTWTNICATGDTTTTRCKETNSTIDGWLTQWNRSANNHFLEFKYPDRLNNEFTEGGISYENLHTDD